MAGRLNRLLAKFDKAGIDSLFVSSEPNVSYISGFGGSESYLYITKKKRFFLTDSRYTEQARKETSGFEIVERDTRPYPQMLESLRARTGARKVGFEASRVSHAFYNQLAKNLPAGSLVPTSGLIESLRIVKDKSEIAELRKAVEITHRGIQDLKSTVVP